MTRFFLDNCKTIEKERNDMICFSIDELTPCLKLVETGELYETECIKLTRKSVLCKYNKATGWYVNWARFAATVSIYALVLKGTYDVQGLIAVEDDNDAKALHIVWACVSPENNIWENGSKKFSGVGGHLFAIATDISLERGFEGYLIGEPMDQELMLHYMNNYGAYQIPSLQSNPFRVAFPPESTLKLKEVYTYDKTDDEI